MRKKMLFVYNPRSGKGLIRTQLADILDIFTQGGYDVIAHPTQGPGDAAAFVRAYAPNVDLVAVSGGDGTLDQAVEGIMKVCPEKTVGYIPAGSTNDFGRSLGIPADMTAAARGIMQGSTVACDVGSFNDHYFVYVAAFGMFTEVSYVTDQELKNNFGHFAYLIEGAKHVSAIPSYHMIFDVDGEQVEGDFTYGMITNSRSVGGMEGIAGRSVDLSDGLFEVTLVHTPTNILDVTEIINALLNDESNAHVKKFKAASIRVKAQTPVSWTLDGEFGGETDTVEIQNYQQALNIAVGKAEEENTDSPDLLSFYGFAGEK